MDYRKVGIAILVVILVFGGGYFVFIEITRDIQDPSFGFLDYGDWGKIENDSVEIISTIWIFNPNKKGVNIGEELSIDYSVDLNGIQVARGQKKGFDIDPGNNTVNIPTILLTRQIQPFWVSYIKNNETMNYTIQSNANIKASISSYSISLPTQKGILFENQTPIITALDNTASSIEGTYTQNLPFIDRQVGYEIKNGDARWGEKTENTTYIFLNFSIHNSGDIPIPVSSDSLKARISMNNIELFRSIGDNFGFQNINRDLLVFPGQTRNISYVLSMNNQNIEDWFITHIRNQEKSSVYVELYFVFSLDRTDTIFRIPQNGGIGYNCSIQTAILVDNQGTKTSCGRNGTTRINVFN